MCATAAAHTFSIEDTDATTTIIAGTAGAMVATVVVGAGMACSHRRTGTPWE